MLKLLRRENKRGIEPKITGVIEARSMKVVKSTMFGQIPLKNYRHILHPPSKLLLAPSTERIGHGKETMKADRSQPNNRILEGYKLEPRKHGFLIDSEKFKRTLSMGPKATFPGPVD